jgi:hypothetical protein
MCDEVERNIKQTTELIIDNVFRNLHSPSVIKIYKHDFFRRAFTHRSVFLCKPIFHPPVHFCHKFINFNSIFCSIYLFSLFSNLNFKCFSLFILLGSSLFKPKMETFLLFYLDMKRCVLRILSWRKNCYALN